MYKLDEIDPDISVQDKTFLFCIVMLPSVLYKELSLYYQPKAWQNPYFNVLHNGFLALIFLCSRVKRIYIIYCKLIYIIYGEYRDT